MLYSTGIVRGRMGHDFISQLAPEKGHGSQTPSNFGLVASGLLAQAAEMKIKWLKSPQKHDYPAARAYLNLLLMPREAKKIVDKLKSAKVQEFAAKDIFRAANVPLLPTSDSDVKKDRRLITSKTPLSPVLLYRSAALRKLIIADGYHRLCAVYSFDEESMIPCQIV
jgi:hypothetical protein